MEVIDLNGSLRTRRGKSEVRRLRIEGHVPGILYGNISDKKSVNFQITRQELGNKVKFPIRQNQLYRFHIKNEKGDQSYLVIIKDWQMNTLKAKWWKHIDLYAIDEKQKVIISVPLKFTGKCVGVTNGGILQPVVREVEVETLPQNIPDDIEV